jgi:rhodanese-related sulfurtransferase
MIGRDGFWDRSRLGEGTMATSIALGEVQELIGRGAQLVEVLPEAEYVQTHLPGAVNLPLKQLDATTSGALDAQRPVVVYCWDSL